MIYVEYEKSKAKYKHTQQIYEDVLSEKEALLKSQSDSERLKMLDETLDGLRKALDDRGKLVIIKEKELRKSKETCDMVYCLRFFENMGVRRIGRNVHYSRTQVYRILKVIQYHIDEIKKEIEK